MNLLPTTLQLAALHSNENCIKAVILEGDDDGQEVPKVRVEYVRWMSGRGMPRLVRAKPTKGSILHDS